MMESNNALEFFNIRCKIIVLLIYYSGVNRLLVLIFLNKMDLERKDTHLHFF